MLSWISGFLVILFHLGIILSGMSGGSFLTGEYFVEKSLMDNPAPKNSGRDDEIKLGLLLAASPEKDPLALAAKQGAELAVLIANKAGGIGGNPVKLIIRTSDGLWGAGSKEVVKFVYEDEVLAIITALDGRNAHLAEQVAAKSHVVQLATRATDETLSQAFVPWFFRIVPNDKQQARALIDEIYYERHLRKVYLVYEEDYDHQMGAKSFKNLLEKEGFELEGNAKISSSEFIGALSSIKKDIEAVVVFGSYRRAQPVLEEIKDSYPEVQVFGSLAMTSDGLIGTGFSNGSEGGVFITSKFCYTTPGKDFKKAFMEKYDRMPNPASSYAFDGINLIVETIRKAGTDKEKIRDVLEGIKYAGGATGSIEFDEYGNRISPVFMISMMKGHPVILHP